MSTKWVSKVLLIRSESEFTFFGSKNIIHFRDPNAVWLRFEFFAEITPASSSKNRGDINVNASAFDFKIRYDARVFDPNNFNYIEWKFILYRIESIKITKTHVIFTAVKN